MSDLIDHISRQLQVEEGVKLRLYNDTKGILSIGVGRNIQANGIRLDEAQLMLANDIKDSVRFLEQFAWYTKCSDVRKAALIDMSFMGAEKLLHFVKMLSGILHDDYEQAAAEIINSKWAADVGPHRSMRVSNMMRTDQWPTDIAYT